MQRDEFDEERWDVKQTPYEASYKPQEPHGTSSMSSSRGTFYHRLTVFACEVEKRETGICLLSNMEQAPGISAKTRHRHLRILRAYPLSEFVYERLRERE